MKSQVDKRKVMIRAWAIFRGKNPYSGSLEKTVKLTPKKRRKLTP